MHDVKSATTLILFVTAHMAARNKNADARNDDYHRILRELEVRASPSFIRPLPLSSSKADVVSDGSHILNSYSRRRSLKRCRPSSRKLWWVRRFRSRSHGSSSTSCSNDAAASERMLNTTTYAQPERR